MSEIEKMRRYVGRTKIAGSSWYSLDLVEGLELSRQAYESDDLPLEIILLAFKYGRAKGYRAAKAESRKEEGVSQRVSHLQTAEKGAVLAGSPAGPGRITT